MLEAVWKVKGCGYQNTLLDRSTITPTPQTIELSLDSTNLAHVDFTCDGVGN